MVRLRLFFFSFLFGFSCLGYAQLNSRFLLQNQSFLSPEFEATDQSQYQFVGINIQNSIDSENVLLDSEAVMAVGTPLLNYLKFNEAAYIIPNSPTQTLILGRKKVIWSELDDSWAFGTVEPVFKWNPLDRESQGLTGLFWMSDLSWVQFTAFVSPVYLPDQGPSFEIDRSGHFAKSNPWFQMPPKTFQPFPGSSASSDIRYQVKKPSESEVVSQTSLGGALEKAIGDHVLLRGSYFYKPMNQLTLGYDGVYNTGTNTGEVEILPQVGYHRVNAADVIYKYEKLRMGVSYIKDQPDPVKFEPEWTAPVLSTAYIYSTFVELGFSKQLIKLEYLTMTGGNVKEVGEFASPDRAPITSRYPFHEAARIRYDFQLPFAHRQSLGMKLAWTHSDLNQFDLIQVKGKYIISKRWQAYADMQLVKAKPIDSKNANEISPHENNDLVMVGMSYEL